MRASTVGGPVWLEDPDWLKEAAFGSMFLLRTEVNVSYDEENGMQQHTTINNTAAGATKHRRTKGWLFNHALWA
jgi:hypothetical protein